MTSAVLAAPPPGRLKAAVEDAVRAELLDPNGAVFSHLDYNGGETYCGYVQYKGSFGRHVFKVWIDPATATLKPNVDGRLAMISLGPRRADQYCPPTN